MEPRALGTPARALRGLGNIRDLGDRDAGPAVLSPALISFFTTPLHFSRATASTIKPKSLSLAFMAYRKPPLRTFPVPSVPVHLLSSHDDILQFTARPCNRLHLNHPLCRDVRPHLLLPRPHWLLRQQPCSPHSAMHAPCAEASPGPAGPRINSRGSLTGLTPAGCVHYCPASAGILPPSACGRHRWRLAERPAPSQPEVRVLGDQTRHCAGSCPTMLIPN